MACLAGASGLMEISWAETRASSFGRFRNGGFVVMDHTELARIAEALERLCPSPAAVPDFDVADVIHLENRPGPA